MSTSAPSSSARLEDELCGHRWTLDGELCPARGDVHLCLRARYECALTGKHVCLACQMVLFA